MDVCVLVQSRYSTEEGIKYLPWWDLLRHCYEMVGSKTISFPRCGFHLLIPKITTSDCVTMSSICGYSTSDLFWVSWLCAVSRVKNPPMICSRGLWFNSRDQSIAYLIISVYLCNGTFTIIFPKDVEIPLIFMNVSDTSSYILLHFTFADLQLYPFFQPPKSGREMSSPGEEEGERCRNWLEGSLPALLKSGRCWYMDVSKNRGKPPKWMVKIMENLFNPWMIWGETPYFWETPIMLS